MNPVIQNLQINSFRGLKGLNLSDLGLVNILVGKNNSGKTTILEAISIACNPLDPFQWIGTSERRLNIGRTPTALRPSLESIKWLFPQEDSNLEERQYQGEIEIGVSGQKTISVRSTISEIYGIGAIKKDDIEEDISISEDINISEAEFARSGVELEIRATAPSDDNQPNLFDYEIEDMFQFWEDERFIQRKRVRVKALLNHIMVYPSYSSSDILLALRLTQITKEGAKDDLLEVLRLFDSEIVNLHIFASSQNRSSLYIEHQKLGFAPFYTFGDGLKKTLLIALALPLAKNGILLIDEIETSIHFSALSQVFTWLIQACKINKTQLFVTTHSLEAVDAMLDADSEKDEVVAFRLNGDEKQPQRFAGELLQRLRSNRGLDVR
ncbi:ATP/GTP-binding protein [Chamaesiphon sp.]|uniref:AAA family ATPase n=1 Tax=Chamaesiphon sp. TaxID=2814140 RepID=UPI003593107C